MLLMDQVMPEVRNRARVRRTRAGTEDPRSVETRARLRAAFERVVLRDGYVGATASRICAEAGTSRSAFYDHFSGPNDVALDVVESLFETLGTDSRRARASGLNSRETSRRALERIAWHLSENVQLYQHLLLSATAPGAVLVRLLEKFAAEALPAVRAARPDLHARGTAQAARVLAGAVLSVMTWWLHEGAPGSPSAFAEDLVDLLPEWSARPSTARREAGGQ
jgi:AcrR family transcriptional regulator